MTIIKKSAVLAGVSTFALLASTAGAVELRSRDGLLSFEGAIASFHNNMLEIATGHGIIFIPAGSVVCIGDECPEGVERLVLDAPVSPSGNQDATDLTIGFETASNRSFIEELLRSGSRKTSLAASLELDDQSLQYSPADGSGVAKISFAETVDAADIVVRTTSAAHSGLPAFEGPEAWASATDGSAHELTTESLAVVISRAAGIDAVSVEDVSLIYAGQIVNWSELGGNDVTILPIQVASGTQANDNLNNALLAPFGLSAGPTVITAPSEELSLQTLGIAPGGIAVVSSNSLGSRQPTAVLNSCDVAVSPDPFTVASGQYPLTLTTLATLSGQAASSSVSDLMDELAATADHDQAAELSEIIASNLARSERVEGILQGVIPAEYKDSARDLVQSIFTATRLAMTFQDGPLTEAIGARGRSDFARMEQAILRGDYDGQEIMFLGFSLDGSDPENSISQSKESAETLLAAFRKFAPEAVARPGITFATDGYGNVGYLNCNVVGNSAQTLVEIWVRPT